MTTYSNPEIISIVRRALAEDIGSGDVTTNTTVSPDLWLDGKFIAKQVGVIAGLDIARLALTLLDERVQMTAIVADGDRVEPQQMLATVVGPGRALLSGERTALNFLQRMSGIATLTRHFVEAVRGTRAVILDTRKTAPGLRALDKMAVHLGGGQNHRIGLYDMVLIKNNHIAAVGGNITDGDPVRRQIEVEVRTLDELQEVLSLNVDRILLDNMTRDEMRRAVEITAHRVPLEASGNVTLETVAQIAATGVDYISSGALTHSVKALDISLWLNTQFSSG
jgi:nicotinate-nucleotide pyrophosphorylase (carboxylating)